MISALWKFINENILNNIFTITLLLLGVVLLIIAVSVGPKLLQKEKRTKRGAIERKVDNEIGESIVEDYKEEEGEDEEDKSSVRTRRKSSVVNYKENPEAESLVGNNDNEVNGKVDKGDKVDNEEDNDKVYKEDGPLNAFGQNLVKAPLGGLNNIVKGSGALGGEENLTSSSKEGEKNGFGKKKRSSKKK